MTTINDALLELASRAAYCAVGRALQLVRPADLDRKDALIFCAAIVEKTAIWFCKEHGVNYPNSVTISHKMHAAAKSAVSDWEQLVS